ncbi:MAG: peptidoglycan editing factor PgeF [Patescibacteria group bacterium]|nr:peptidoglycan editing factor PgeF [Patescibacteria group bacterium]
MIFINDKNIYSGISEKKDGPMKNSVENRFLFFKNKGLNDKIIISAGLVHGNKVAIVDNLEDSQIILDCDALITNHNKYLLTITVADCLPIYFYDEKKKVIALAHAGWRGVISEIVEKVIIKFTNYYHSDLKDINVFIGPYIRPCHFEIKDDVANKFKSSDIINRAEKKYIDMAKIVKDQLIQLKIQRDKINISDDCTYCLEGKYFSYRRDNPSELETMIAYIGLK